ncbi:MAG TPA: hypothetical protein VN823_01940 [Stellaceae bacterium]|nr:hypothetical protein [Stellaceae bacterium]
MPDFLHLSAALLALLGLFLWFWSGGIQAARLKRQIRRVAIFAALASALLQAAGSAQATENPDVELWASAAPVDAAPIG